jgi:hypothetical protein
MKLNPKDAADAGKQNKDGYTNIESYFNEWLLK